MPRQVRYVLGWAQKHPCWVLIPVFSIGMLVLFAWGVCAYWAWLVEVPSGKESGSTIVRSLGLLLIALIALPLAIWRSFVAHRQSVTAQHGLLNERYQKGAEMLGSEALSVRLGGIYGLGRLAEQYTEEYHLQIMGLFCAYVRDLPADRITETIGPSIVSPVRIDQPISFTSPPPTIREDVQAVITLIGERSNHGRTLERSQFPKSIIDLSRAALAFADLKDANLTGARLYKADLSSARLVNANLSSTQLVGVDLNGASLRNADLSGAYLRLAKMDHTFLNDANLSGSLFSRDGKEPATGLTQTQLDTARADSGNPPELSGVLDAETGKPLVWSGKPLRAKA